MNSLTFTSDQNGQIFLSFKFCVTCAYSCVSEAAASGRGLPLLGVAPGVGLGALMDEGSKRERGLAAGHHHAHALDGLGCL